MKRKNDMKRQAGDKIISFAPASVANVGPCYDIMGYSLDFVGDFAEVTLTDKAGEFEWLGVQGAYASALKDCAKSDNAAYVVAHGLWTAYQARAPEGLGVQMMLHKYMPVGSGLGSSAASGVAAGKAILELTGWDDAKRTEQEEDELFSYLLRSEGATAFAQHPDNVIPAYMGGFVIIHKTHVARLDCPEHLISVVVKPDYEITTLLARESLRDFVIDSILDSGADQREQALQILGLVSGNSSLAALMSFAAASGDVALVGEIMQHNDLLEGGRAQLIPCLPEVKKAAMRAGAYGCTISGAGPAIVAVTDTQDKAINIKTAMVKAVNAKDALWLISPGNTRGARIVTTDIAAELRRGKEFHNFFAGPS